MDIDFSTLTACGECCVGCKKREEGFCLGCIETEGHCAEWSGSGGCPIYLCAHRHNVTFCGICPDFPCAFLSEKVTWNKNIIAHQTELARLYRRK